MSEDETAAALNTVPGSYPVIAHGSSTSEGLSEAARQYREGGAETDRGDSNTSMPLVASSAGEIG